MAVRTTVSDQRGQKEGGVESAVDRVRRTVEDTSPPPVSYSDRQVDRVRSINHHLRMAIEQVGEGVLIVEARSQTDRDAAPRIVFANRAAGALTGRKASALIGEPLGVIYDPEALEHLVSRLPSVERSDKTYQMEKGALLDDGSVEKFRWSIRSVHDEQGRPVNFVMTLRPAEVDLDEAVATEAEATVAEVSDEDDEKERELHAHLEKSRIESLAQLAGGIAHDFNNVLTSIFSNLSLAKLSSAPGSDVRRHVEDALEASQNAQSLAQQILDFTKGRVQSIELVDMARVVEKTAKMSMMGSQVRCDVCVEDDIWGVEADLVQIRQVVHNFFINAAQAMPDGGVVQARVKNTVVDEMHPVGDLPAGAYVKVVVRDRGCGISSDNLKRIFDPYFTTKDTGSGIGLATCRTIVQRHRGTIAVQSKLHIGSEFSLYLPACTIEEATEPIDPAVASAGGAGDNILTGDGAAGKDTSAVISGQGSVLVVDDQDDVRLSAERLLERLGYKTYSVGDGQEAVRLYQKQLQGEEPIAAVLLDMTLPGGLSGDEVMEEIRKIDGDARVIATSGWFDDDAEQRFLIDGYVGILPKPYAVESLSQKLHDAMTG